MNKRNFKHAFKKAWEDLKTFWTKILDKIKNTANKNTNNDIKSKKKYKSILVIILLLLLVIFANTPLNCNTPLDNQAGVLTVNAEEETATNTTLLANNYTELQTLFDEDVLFRQTYTFPYTASYFYQLSSSYDFDVDLQPLDNLYVEFVYNVTQGCYVAFSYSDTIFNTNLGITVSISSGYYALSPTLSTDTVYFYPKVAYYDIGGDMYYIIEYYCALVLDGSSLITYNSTVCAETQLYDFCSTSLDPYNPSGSATNMFFSLFQKQSTPAVSFPFTLYSMLGDSYNFNYQFNNGNSFVTNDFGNIVLNKYMYYLNGDTYEISVNPYDLFLQLPFYNMPTGFVNYSHTSYFPPVSGDSNEAFLRGKDYGYDLGLEDGYKKGYGEGFGDASIGGGGTTEYWRGYDAGKKDGVSEEYNRIVSEDKPIWEEEAKTAEYNRIVSEDKPIWEEEAKTAEYNRIVSEDKPIWEEEAYNRGLRDGEESSSGSGTGKLTYTDGYEAGKQYMIDNYKYKWQQEAKHEEYQRIETELKPVWQQEAKTAEYNRIVSEDKPIWEEEAYNRGLDASGVEFDPFDSLSKSINSLLGTPLLSDDNGNTMVSIGTLFRVGIGVLLFGVLIKVFLGG